MPGSTSSTTAKLIRWTSTDPSVQYFDVYRREDAVTASITTADIVAKVGFGSDHYVDVGVENKPYWYWIKAVSWAGHSSAFSNTVPAPASTASMVIGGGLTICGTVTLNSTVTINASVDVSGSLTVHSAATVKGNLTVNGGATCNDYLIVASSIKTLFVEFTASANPPQPTAGGTLRLYAKDTGGSTVLCSINTAGAVTQYGAVPSISLNDLFDVDTTGVNEGDVIAYSSSGSWKARAQSGGGGGGNALFVEAGGVTKIDTDGQDAYLNFNTSDFVLATASGESATVSLASGLKLNGGITVSGNVTIGNDTAIGGKLTVSGLTSINDNLKVTGTLTVDGGVVLNNALTVSGLTTINHNLAVTGTVTVDGTTNLKGALNVVGTFKPFGAVQLQSTLSVLGAATFNNTVKMNKAVACSSGITVDGSGVFNNTLSVSGTTTLNGDTFINNSLLVSGVTTLLNQVRIATTAGETNAGVTFVRTWVDNATNHYGVHIVEHIALNTPNTTVRSGAGLGGYVVLANQAFGTYYVPLGLDYSLYEIGATVGHTSYVTAYGARIGGAAGFGGIFNAATITGLKVGMVAEPGVDYYSDINATVGFGIIIDENVGLGGTKTFGTVFQLFVKGIYSVTSDANKWAIWVDNGKSYFKQNVSGAAGEVLHIHQDHASGGKGCLKLTQDHDGVPFMSFYATAGAGTGYSVNTSERNTFNCMIPVNINGTTRWLKVYA